MTSSEDIKGFVAYKFDEIDNDALSLSGFSWVPVLFPYNPHRNLYFITLTISDSEGWFEPKGRESTESLKKVKLFDNDIVDSIYVVCGYNPLFLIADAKSPDDIRIAIPHNIHTRYMSINTPHNIIKRFGRTKSDFKDICKDPNFLENLESIEESIERVRKNNELSKEYVENEFRNIEGWENFVRFVPIDIGKIINIILIYPPDNETEKGVINKVKEDPRVIDVYKVTGECRLIIKIVTEDTLETYRFVESLMNRRIHTVTKTVLSTHKENGKVFDMPLIPKLKTDLTPIKKDILRYLWEDYEALVLDRDAQINRFREEYFEDQRYLPWSKEDLEKKFDSVEDEFVYKYSVKLDREGWFKTLLFIKSSLTGKQYVWDGIINSLLGVDHASYFARKLYAVTGDFDFIVPIDCYKLDSVKTKIRYFLENTGEYVSDTRAYFEGTGGAQKELKMDEIACIKSMMPNSKKSEEGGDETPRDAYYRYYIESLNKEMEKLGMPTQNTREIESTEIMTLANVRPVVELHSEKLVHVFVRFKVKYESKFEDDLKELKRDGKHLFLCREYNPIHSPDSRMFILTTENFESLLSFISTLDKHSRNTVISLIFMQDFFRPTPPIKYRCKPCRLPITNKCDACGEYIKQTKKINVRDVDLKSHGMDVDLKSHGMKGIISPCNIAVVQLKIEDMIPLYPWSENCKKDRDEIKKCVFGYLDKILKESNPKPDIILFPDMSILGEWIPEIKTKIEKHKIMVIASTHLKEYEEDDGYYYNVCPVLISNGRKRIIRYDVHKNHCDSENEEQLERDYNIKLREGMGMLRFINTGFGNIAILVCRDFVTTDQLSEMTRELHPIIDILIVPSWNKGVRRFAVTAENIARNGACFVVIANNGKIGDAKDEYGQSGLFAPYHGEARKYLEKIREQYTPGCEGYHIYTIDSLQLDIWRDQSTRKILTNKTKRNNLLKKLEDNRIRERLEEIPKKFGSEMERSKPLHKDYWPEEIK